MREVKFLSIVIVNTQPTIFNYMTLAVILAIIAIGLLLIFLEIFLIPGTTLFGIAGGVAVVIGVLLVYYYYGSYYGNISFAVSLVAVLVSVFFGFRVIESNKLAMKAEIDGKVNNEDVSDFQIGQTGHTLTDLRPNGKAKFEAGKTEVYSVGDFINRDTNVQIVKITGNKIYVQPLNT